MRIDPLELTASERAAICNGCGPRGFSWAVPDFVYVEACDEHDADYFVGYRRRDRLVADLRFLVRMWRCAWETRSPVWRLRFCVLAVAYFLAVRALGARAFYYGDGPRTRADIPMEE